MRFFKPKPSATALNEITAIIIDTDKKTAMHKTFIADLSTDTEFTFAPDAPKEGKSVTAEELKQYTYKLPKGDATHYNPTFIQVDLKLALFFSRHKIWAALFDWFHLRDKAVFPVGFIYRLGTSDPLKPKSPKHDYALENWNIRHNTVVDLRLKHVGEKINRTQSNPTKWAMIIGAVIIIVIIAVVALKFIMTGDSQPPPVVVQNTTIPTLTPSPTPRVLWGP